VPPEWEEVLLSQTNFLDELMDEEVRLGELRRGSLTDAKDAAARPVRPVICSDGSISNWAMTAKRPKITFT